MTTMIPCSPDVAGRCSTAPPPSHVHFSVRAQAAVVQTLLDEVERVSARACDETSEQLVEELARLGGMVLEMAATLQIASATPPPAAPHETRGDEP